MKIQNIQETIQLIDEAIAWSEEKNVRTFPKEVFKAYRRKFAKINEVALENKAKSASKVVARDVVSQLSVFDIVLSVIDAYYDGISNKDTLISYAAINQRLPEILPQVKKSKVVQNYITEDDILELGEYLQTVIGVKAANCYQSDFCKILAPAIAYVPATAWCSVLSFLWNDNANVTKVFESLLERCGLLEQKADGPMTTDAELKQMQDELNLILQVYKSPKSKDYVQKVVSDIQALLDRDIENNQELFGKIQDCLMIKSDAVRKIMYQAYEEQAEMPSDVLTARIVDYWMQYINNHVKELNTMLPHAEEVVYALLTIFQNSTTEQTLVDGVTQYQDAYGISASEYAMADYMTFELNRFVTTYGRTTMDYDVLQDVQALAEKCNVKISDVSPLAINSKPQRQDAKQALEVLEKSAEIEQADMVTIMNMSLWDSFPKWINFITIGLLAIANK